MFLLHKSNSYKEPTTNCISKEQIKYKKNTVRVTDNESKTVCTAHLICLNYSALVKVDSASNLHEYCISSASISALGNFISQKIAPQAEGKIAWRSVASYAAFA